MVSSCPIGHHMHAMELFTFFLELRNLLVNYQCLHIRRLFQGIIEYDGAESGNSGEAEPPKLIKDKSHISNDFLNYFV